MLFRSITLVPGTYTVVLQWSDSIYSIGQTTTGTAYDVDFYLTKDNGKTLFGFNRNNIGGDPIEVLSFTVTENTTSNFLVVSNSNAPVFFKYVVFRGELVINEHQQGVSTIVGQANAAGAISTGAVLYSNTPRYGVDPPTVTSFSSRGGTLVNGVDRNKPDICAPNGGNTTVYMGGVNIDNDAFPNFFGTSAAAPHATGVGALLAQAKKKYYGQSVTPDEVRAILKTTAVDMYTNGYDINSGSGFINADAALRSIAEPNPELIQLVVPPNVTPGDSAFTLNVTGNYFSDNSSVIFRDDTLPTTFQNQNLVTAEIPEFMGNPQIYVYTPPVSTSGLDGGNSNV